MQKNKFKLLAIFGVVAFNFFLKDTVLADSRMINFAGRSWYVRSGLTSKTQPGNNYWNDTSDSVWVDNLGKLHLKIKKINNKWYSAEVYTKDTVKYGLYTIVIDTDLGKLDKNVCGSPFLYKDDNHEIDIVEVSKWGTNNVKNAQHTVQPWGDDGHMQRFTIGSYSSPTTHKLHWFSSGLRFESLYSENSTYKTISDWTFSGKDFPKESDGLAMIINLYLVDGAVPPSDGNEVEFIVSDIKYSATEATSATYGYGNTLPPTTYGYGIKTYGYGNTLPPTSYGYGIKTYGYGNTLPPTSYGYGIKTYGYGNTLPPTTYGYGVVNTIKCSIGYQKVTINGKTECRIINDKNIFENLEKRIVEWKNIAAKQIATINHQIQTLQTKKNSINKDLEIKILKERAKIYGAYGYGNNTLFQKAVKGIKIWFNGNK